ncbi:sialidase family protein [Chitinophaga rhizosphaerae]|uniref:sialidase family protein n=1 Tax=Chitinophaga rhizosphaerae TaxID=1864947 RepID=UPI000F810ADC|nr:sialidase family protein [Chitinophaga rhizosphaerae]
MRMNRSLPIAAAMAMIGLAACSAQRPVAQPPAEETHVVFEPGGLYASMRIPALAVTKKHTLLAFCEARIGTASDWADMHLALRRSIDEGKTWSPIHVLDSFKQGPVGNPVPIVDDRGTVHLLYQKDYKDAFYISSEDDGRTWSKPRDITPVFGRFKPEYDWKVLAPGPGHGIQLKNGRLLSAVWLADSRKLTPRRSHHPSCMATVYSDDYGKTWERGAIVADSSALISNPNESQPVQLPDGKVLMSIRSPSAVKRRAFSVSANGISDWSEVRFAEELFDPTCMASIVSVTSANGKNALVFVNPDSKDIEKNPRKNLTARASFDNGQTWPVSKVLDPGAAGYSDLATGPGNIIYCLYETNTKDNKGWNYSLVLKKFYTNWITR